MNKKYTSSTTAELMDYLVSLVDQLRNPSEVSEEEMNKLYPIFGDEYVIKRYKKKQYDEINEEIDRVLKLIPTSRD